MVVGPAARAESSAVMLRKMMESRAGQKLVIRYLIVISKLVVVVRIVAKIIRTRPRPSTSNEWRHVKLLKLI